MHTKFQLPGWTGSNVPGFGGWVGWLETDDRAISVQLNLTGTGTGIELGKTYQKVEGCLAPLCWKHGCCQHLKLLGCWVGRGWALALVRGEEGAGGHQGLHGQVQALLLLDRNNIFLKNDYFREGKIWLSVSTCRNWWTVSEINYSEPIKGFLPIFLYYPACLHMECILSPFMLKRSHFLPNNFIKSGAMDDQIFMKV